jgi:hypothetical protein
MTSCTGGDDILYIAIRKNRHITVISNRHTFSKAENAFDGDENLSNEKPICGKPTPNGPCILERNHATPRAVGAPCTVESYSDGSAIESFGCFGVRDSDDEIAQYAMSGETR